MIVIGVPAFLSLVFNTNSMSLPEPEEDEYPVGYVESVERTAVIRMKGIPDTIRPYKWAVMLESREYDLENDVTETHEVARIDNYHEGKPVHIHRKFEEGDPEENLRHLSFDEAREYLDDNCEEFMRKYFEQDI